MKPERYNIFQKTHKKLARLVFDAGHNIQKISGNDPEEINVALNQILQATHYFEYHIRKEDSIIYNAVASIAPFIISEIEKSNAADLCLASTIEDEIENLYPFTGRGHLGNSRDLRTSFFAFTAAVLLHINKEETVINDLLWEIYSDEQLIEFEQSLIKSTFTGEKYYNADQLNQWFTERGMVTLINGVMISKNNSNTEMLLPCLDSVEAA